jgi:hypothetical protein
MRHVRTHDGVVFLVCFYGEGIETMKRIALLVCGLLLLVANTAEARRRRWSNNRTVARPAAAAPATHTAYRPVYAAPVTEAVPADAAEVADSPSADSASEAAVTAAGTATTTSAATTPVTTAAATTTAATNVRTVSYSTSTAQGVANLMASYNRVGHFGGNRGYEGCGCGATPAAAYAICCYGNSGMATIDVGYAQGANGMWYCCRRYR